MIAEIIYLRETGACEFRFVPRAVVVLHDGQVADSPGHGLMALESGGDQSHDGPGGLRGRGIALPAEMRMFVAFGRFAPAAAGLLMGQKPIGPGGHGRVFGRHAHGGQSGYGLPGAVDVIHSPASEPTAVGLLGAADIGHGPVHGRIAQPAAEFAQGLQHAAGHIRGAGIDHGIMIGEGDVAEKFAVVVAIERAPAAVVVLHGQDPLLAAADGLDTLFQR